jgi:hypothetical protein
MEKNDIRNLMAVTNGTHIDSKILSIFINTIEKISKFSVFFKLSRKLCLINLTTIYDMPAYKIGYMLSGNSFPAVFLFPGCHTKCTASHTITFTMPFFPFGTTTVME